TQFLVHETINPKVVWPAGNLMVRLNERLYDCGKFQKVHMPFSQVVAACKNAHHEYMNYIHLVYTLKSVSNVYRGLFGELRNKTYWLPCHKPRICPNLEKKINSKGRVVSSHINTEMDIRELDQPK
ncbi:hypothetical protein glysoja_046655, partial [Glycine soja]